jgi:hypothetical protein
MENFDKQLIAPCGMNCAICSRYLAYKNNLTEVKGKIIHCAGCRPDNKKCALQKICADNRKLLKREIAFCFECNCFPCDRLKKLDDRYQRNYNMSMIENLMNIKTKGISKFMKHQFKKYKCPKCDGLKSVHSGKCFACDTI